MQAASDLGLNKKYFKLPRVTNRGQAEQLATEAALGGILSMWKQSLAAAAWDSVLGLHLPDSV